MTKSEFFLSLAVPALVIDIFMREGDSVVGQAVMMAYRVFGSVVGMVAGY